MFGWVDVVQEEVLQIRFTIYHLLFCAVISYLLGLNIEMWDGFFLLVLGGFSGPWHGVIAREAPVKGDQHKANTCPLVALEPAVGRGSKLLFLVLKNVISLTDIGAYNTAFLRTFQTAGMISHRYDPVKYIYRVCLQFSTLQIENILSETAQLSH